MGIRPWEFEQYTMDDFISTRRGSQKAERLRLENEWVHFQFMGFYILMAQGCLSKSDQRKPIDQIIPNIYAPIVEKGSLKDQFEARREAARKRTEELKKRVSGKLQNRSRLHGKPGQPDASRRPRGRRT